jgi:hypothetical protein
MTSWTLPEVLKVLETTKTEAQLIAQIGPPHGVAPFSPGSTDDAYPLNRLPKDDWQALLISSPVGLLDTVPLGTRMLIYSFSYTPSLTGGGLLVFVSSTGEILGWSYSKSIDEKRLRGRATMDKRDFKK